MGGSGTAASIENREGGKTARVIRFEVDGKWSMKDLTDFISAIQEIYVFILIIYSISDAKKKNNEYSIKWKLNDFDNFLISKKSPYLDDSEVLQVKRISYSSPGQFDFLGLGAIVGHIKEFLLETLKIIMAREKYKLENELIVKEVEEKRILNEKKKLENKLLIQEIEEKKLNNEVKKLESKKKRKQEELEISRLELEIFKLEKENSDLYNKKIHIEYGGDFDSSLSQNIEKLIATLSEDTTQYLGSWRISRFLDDAQERVSELIKEKKITEIRLLSSEDKGDKNIK